MFKISVKKILKGGDLFRKKKRAIIINCFTQFLSYAEVYSEPCQISKMEFFSLIIFAKSSNLDVQLASEYVSGIG